MKKKSRKLLLGFDRALSQSIGKQVLILLIAVLALFGISLFLLSASGADWQGYCDAKGINKWALPLYFLIDGNSFNDLYTFKDYHVGKYMLVVSGIIFVLGFILLTGAFISVMTNIVFQRVKDHRHGLIHYLKSGHYIIMGFDDMVPSIINEIFIKDPDAYVLMMSALNAETVKEKLLKSFTEKELKRIINNYGLRTSEEYYSDIHLESAAEIYIVGNRSLPAHDAMNVECVDHICSYLKSIPSDQKPKRITCVFEDLDTYAAFKTSEIFGEVRDLGIEFVPYNFYTGWAKQVFVDQSYREKKHPRVRIAYPSVYGCGIKPDDPKRVHLVFVGISNFGAAFAMEAAHMLHFPNFDEITKKPKTLITFIEKNAEAEMAQFMTRNRHLFEVQSYYYRDLSQDTASIMEPRKDWLAQGLSAYDFLDVEFEFIKGDIYSQKVQNEIKQWALDEGQYLSIFLTMADQRSNFMMGLNMPDEVYSRQVPVFIRQDRADNFVTQLRNADNKAFDYNVFEEGTLKTEQRKRRFATLYPFGMDDTAYWSIDRSFRQAMLINFLYNTADYENFRFKSLADLDAMGADAIWQQAEEEWKKLSVALKWSNLYSAYNFPCKLASLRAMRGLEPNDTSHDLDIVSQEELDILGHVEHNRWNVEKLLMGFRKAKEDEDKYEHQEATKQLSSNKKLFIHHDIRPFNELDVVKKLDSEIVKYIPWMLKMTKDPC